MLSARVSYVLLILIATIVEVGRYPDLGGALSRLRYAVDPALNWHDAYDALRNVFLFSGLGAIWLVTSPSTRLRNALWRATAVGFVLSLAVEGLQLFTAARVASVADLVTNTLGTFAGALGAGLLVAAVRIKRGHRTTLGIPFFLFAIGHFGALLSEVLAPRFGSDALAGMAGGPRARIARAMHAAIPFDWGRLSALDILLALPAGAFSHAALVELGVPRWIAVLAVAIGGGLLVFAIEVSHGTAGLAVNWNAAVAAVLGLLVGAALAAISITFARTVQGVRRARLVASLTVASILLWCWRPFLPRASGSEILAALVPMRFQPLREYPYSAGLLGVAQVVQLASLGFLVGVLLAVWPLRARGPLSYVWPAAMLAGAVELGHLLIAGRIIDVTGFLLLFAGAWLGDAVVRRAGFTPYGEMLDSSAFPVSPIPLAGPHRR